MPETSDKTRVHVVTEFDEPAQTVMAAGYGDVKYSQTYVATNVPAPPSSARGDKPPYRVPLMTEINELPPNGLTVVSTFSGCGGSCLGFKLAGFRVLWANEFVPAAQDTYRANHPDTFLCADDVRTVTAASIREVIGDVDVDVLEGSPPCASFSTAGKQQRGWGQVRKYSDVEQRTDDLFGHYVRLVSELRPRAFVAENVAGMVKGASKGFFKRYLAMMRALPYDVEARVLDAQFLGVPQRRARVIFVGIRKDVGAAIRWPAPLPYRYSVRDALPWLAAVGGIRATGFAGHELTPASEPSPTVMAGGGGGMNTSQFGVVEARLVGGNGAVGAIKGAQLSLDEPAPTVLAGGEGPHGRRDRDDQFVVELRRVEPESALAAAVGREWDKLKPGEQSDRYMNLILPREDEPCPTVTQLGGTSAASVAHPYERRKFSLAELRRICGFPDDFVLTGTYAQGWERLGRSVPPMMMFSVASALARSLRDADAKKGTL